MRSIEILETLVLYVSYIMFPVPLTAYYNVDFEMSDQMMYLNIQYQKPSSLHKASSNALEHLPRELRTFLNGTIACIEYGDCQCKGYVKKPRVWA